MPTSSRSIAPRRCSSRDRPQRSSGQTAAARARSCACWRVCSPHRPERSCERPVSRPPFIAQQHEHHDWMPVPVDEVIRMGCYRTRGLLGRVTRADRAEIHAVAERLHVADLLRRSFSELSGGQRQRVLVAQAPHRFAEAVAARRTDHRPRPAEPGDDPVDHRRRSRERRHRGLLDPSPRGSETGRAGHAARRLRDRRRRPRCRAASGAPCHRIRRPSAAHRWRSAARRRPRTRAQP